MLYTEKSVLRYYVRFSQIQSHIIIALSPFPLHSGLISLVNKYRYGAVHNPSGKVENT